MAEVSPGPGNCLGLLASKTGPTAVRGQYYGLVAAIGKVGAFCGTWGRRVSLCFLLLQTHAYFLAFPPLIQGTHD
jgi:hypothetical protein